jgi:Fur family ferric uptake transcriptional regulator
MSKDEVDEILERLRRHGGRVTTPRRVILDAMLTADDHHLVAADIVATVRQQHPDFYESTVYRTLDRLVELQIVDRIQLGQGPAVFHLSHRPHQHLVCDQCGAVSEADPDLLDEVAEVLEGDQGFLVNPTTTTLHGLCAACRA